ncbi:MAG: hypothetical protein IKW10_05115 [Oscillospiraceae bacterium]|nr:hypothetical protein [Oscillospiraceae bacterium]
MKKQQKSKKLLWVLLPVVLIVLAALILTLVLSLDNEKSKAEAYESKIYWNVERGRYVSQGYHGVSSRIPDSDGYYRINMAVEGEQKEVLVSDPALVNRIDFEEVMGLTFDENGIVDGILYLDEFTGGIAADKFVVVSINGNTVVCNTSSKYKGMDVTFEISEDAGIWMVGDFEPMVGLPTAISEGDQVLMIRDRKGSISQVYVFPFVPPGDVYWNITRMWDSDGQCTTRQRDSLGNFNYEFAVNGEIQTLKTKSQDVANLIDKHASQNMGLVFDEEGYIIEVLNAGNAVCGGGLLCNRYIVTALNGDQMTTALNTNSYTSSISKDCKFFDVSGNGRFIGAPADGVQLGDRVTVLKDRRDQVCIVFITNRLTTDDIYWVVERNQVWNRTTWTTDRKPAADGWYYIKLAGNGKQITAKCDDAELVNKLDSYVCWCVALDGDEIVGIQDATNRYGGSLFGAFNELISIDGKKLTIQKTNDTASAMMADDCVVYNVSTSSITVGEPSYIREGDTIYGFTDIDGFVRYIFVTSTTYDGEIYWNMTRMYDNDKKETTRKPADDGYYYFEMVCNGKIVWLKTADKEIATKVDLVRTRVRGLKLSGDVILDVLAPEKLTDYPGVKPDVSWKGITQIDGRKITIDNNGKAYTFKLASGCKIYNVSGVYEKSPGEITTLREGDYIVTLVNEQDQVVIVYVCGGRKKTFNTNQEKCPCSSGAVWQKWDGTGKLTSGYYYLTKNVTAPAGGWLLDGVEVHLRLDGHTIRANGRAFAVKNKSTLSICDHKTRGKIVGVGTINESGGLIQIAQSNVTVNLYNIDIDATGLTAENGGAISVSGWLSMYNVNVYGGSATKKGGNIAVMPTGTFRMFGGSIKDGAAVLTGQNLYITGNCYLENAAIQAGVSASVADRTFIINGANISKGFFGLDMLAGELILSGDVNITGNYTIDLRLQKDAKIRLDGISKNSRVNLIVEKTGVFCEAATETDASIFGCLNPDNIVYYADGKLSVRMKHTHGLSRDLEEIGFVKLTQDSFDGATQDSRPVRLSGHNYVLAAGSYYLGEDINLPGQILVYENVDLCLNGKKLSATNSRSFALTGAVLNITDCTMEGQICGGTTGNAANILLQGSKGGNNGEGSELNLYAGTLVGGTTTASAGAHGGNVQIYLGTFNIYGGTLTGGAAKGFGGTIYINPGQKLNIYGGQILVGSASKGSCVMAAAGAEITLKGLVQVDQIHLGDKELTVEELANGSKIGIVSGNMGVIASNVQQDWSAMFHCGEDNSVVYNSADKTLSYTFAHMHCICKDFAGHACAQKPWIGLSQADILEGSYTLDADTYYYLKEDVTLSKNIAVGSGKTLNLCLNGHTITAPSAARAFVLSGGTMNLTDCCKTGNVVATNAATGAAILVQGSKGASNGILSTFNMYGGTITGGQAIQGGTVAVTGGTMNLYGGKLIGGTATKNGGTLYVEKGQTLNLYGGELTSGTAAVGECLYADTETSITIDGSVVLEAVYLNGTQLVVGSVADDFTTVINAAASGVLIQNIEEAVAAKFTTVTEHTLTYDSEAKTLSMTIPVIYEHGHCLCNGFEGHACTVYEWTGLTANDVLTGNFTATANHYYYLTESVTLTSPITLAGADTVLNLCLSEFTITAPSANRAFVLNGATLNLTACKDGGTIIGGRHTKNGGMFYIQGVSGNKGEKGQLNLYGGILRGGSAQNGGVAYVSWGAMNVYGGVIQGGNVTNAAAAVWVNNGQSMQIFGGQIYAGTGAKKGNGILALPDSVVTVGGNAQVEEIYLNQSGMLLQVSEQYPLKDTAWIGVQMLTPGVFAEGLKAYIPDTFISKHTAKVIYWDPETGKLSLTDPVSTA